MTVDTDQASTCVGTVLFTDLVGFTEYTDAAGDAAAVAVLELQTTLAQQAIDDCHAARIVKELGDGLLVWFASASEAMAAATSLMSSVARSRQDGSFPLSVRMGMHHGEALERGDDVVGQTVNIASRIADLAGPGELLVSEHVLVACRPAASTYALHPVGPVLVKGVRDPVWLQRIQA